jgi:hypothetical protein
VISANASQAANRIPFDQDYERSCRETTRYA